MPSHASRGDSGADDRGGVLLEFLRVGAALKVTAIDAVTGEEVSIVGDPAHGQDVLAEIATAKLRRQQARRHSWRPIRRRRSGAGDTGEGNGGSGEDTGPGILV